MAHHHDHSHAHDHAGHSHVPDNFGRAFAIGAILNTAFVAAELFFGYAANSLALISDAVHNLSDVDRAAAGMGRGVACAEAADAEAYLRLPARLDPRCAVQRGPAAGRGRRHRRRGDQPAARAGGGVGLDRRLGCRSRRRHQRRDRVVVHARPPRRPQYSRRLSAHGGGCGRLARRGGRGVAHHAHGMAVARSRDQPRHCRRGALRAAGGWRATASISRSTACRAASNSRKCGTISAGSTASRSA